MVHAPSAFFNPQVSAGRRPISSAIVVVAGRRRVAGGGRDPGGRSGGTLRGSRRPAKFRIQPVRAAERPRMAPRHQENAVMIAITELATRKIDELMESQGKPGQALRIGITGRGPGGFQYRLAFVDLADRATDDVVVDAGPFQVLVDAVSAADLEGTRIDYVETPVQCGFQIDNPNPLWRDATALAVQKVIDDEINPAVGGHGGFVTLLDVKEGVAYIRFGGGCQGCGMVDTTLKQGVAVRIKEAVPAIREILDTTDHAGGTNPFYRAT
jgi:Fe/S biogenesis protein NfuA